MPNERICPMVCWFKYKRSYLPKPTELTTKIRCTLQIARLVITVLPFLTWSMMIVHKCALLPLLSAFAATLSHFQWSSNTNGRSLTSLWDRDRVGQSESDQSMGFCWICALDNHCHNQWEGTIPFHSEDDVYSLGTLAFLQALFLSI